MRYFFADTVYWSALFSPRDQMHDAAAHMSRSLGRDVQILTSDLVLAEFLNSFAGRGAEARVMAADSVAALRDGHRAIVEPLTTDSFRGALESYRMHNDNRWSLTDCLSFLIMQRYGIKEALTADHHFEQAGFHALLR